MLAPAGGSVAPRRAEGVPRLGDGRGSVPGRVPDALGDRAQLETVLHNLIVNAVDALKGQRGSRTIRLSAEIGEPGFVRVSVTDNGPGVPQGIAATLFQPLASSKTDGLGLGLAISRTIVEAHGGRLWLDSAAHGALFCLSLPVET